MKPEPYRGHTKHGVPETMDRHRTNPHPSSPRLSAHMRRRCAQRGTNRILLVTVHDWADIEIPVGSGAVALSLSRDTAREMRAEGIPADLVDRALRRAIVQSDGRDLTVITGRERRGRHYRRRTRRGSDRGTKYGRR